MATRNAGDVSVRFSVENAEAVRKALQALGADGDRALKQMDAAGKPVSGTFRAVLSVVEDLKGRATAAAGSTGVFGSALLSIGPAGLVAGAVLGSVYLAFQRVAEGGKAFGQFARDVRDGAAQTGLAIPDFQALIRLFGEHQVEVDKATAALNRFGVARDQAARGQGELYQALRRVNPVFAEQFASARSTAAAIDVFARALAQADDHVRQFLIGAAFGKGGGGLGQAMIDLAGRGGVGAVTDALVRAGKGFDANVIEKQAAAATAAAIKARDVENAWNGAYAAIFEKWRDFKKNILGLDAENSIKIAIVITKLIADPKTLASSPGLPSPDVQDAFNAAAERMRRQFRRRGAVPEPVSQLPPFPENFGERFGEGQTFGRSAPGVPLPQGRPDAEAMALALERNAKNLREYIQFLGAAATPQMEFKAREMELAAEVLRGTRTQEDYNRAKGALALALDKAAVAQRTSLGLIDQEGMLRVRQADIDKLFADKIIKSAEEKREAERLMRLEVQQTTEALQVRASLTPALTKLGQDAGNFAKNLDTGFAGALQSITSEFSLLNKSTDTFAQKLEKVGLKMADAVLQAILLKPLVQPLANLFSAGFGGLFGGPVKSAQGNIFGPGGIMAFAGGGIVHRPTIFPFAGGTGLIGEAGPEAIMPLRRGPDGRLGVDAAGGGWSNVNFKVINQAGVDVSMRQRRRPDGGIDVVQTIREIVNETDWRRPRRLCHGAAFRRPAQGRKVLTMVSNMNAEPSPILRECWSGSKTCRPPRR